MIFSKIEGSKNEFIHTYFTKSLSNFVHDFQEDCFNKPKPLLVAKTLIYLNKSISISKIHSPRPLRAP